MSDKDQIHQSYNNKVSQIVFILLDKSYSMEELFQDQQTRLDSAKQFIKSFLNASNSTNTLYGLISFNHRYTINCDLTSSISQLQTELEKIEIEGSTHIFKTIENAAYRLIESQYNYPNAIKRIIVITDGCDNHADFTYEGERFFQLDIGKLSQRLIENEIRVDSIYLSDEIDPRLYKITKMTGCCSFKPLTFEEGLNIVTEESFCNSFARDFIPFSNENLNHDQIQNTPKPDNFDKHTPSKLS